MLFCRRWWLKSGLIPVLLLCIPHPLFSQEPEFVTRSNDTLRLGNHAFYFVGANAYYLLEQAARGDTATVQSLFRTVQSLGMNVVRTWGFFDSPDSTNPAVIQYRPGVFQERALQALDYVVYQARRYNIRLLVPLVNSWDDYGGMNQYVRWRAATYAGGGAAAARFPEKDRQRIVRGGNGRQYLYSPTAQFSHDDFYSDSLIVSWYKQYISAILQRTNVYTNIAYKDEPFILGWELANEPRSSDRSGGKIAAWVEVLGEFVKSVDANHLLGTGEEGFDVSGAGYSTAAYNGQQWLFDGTAGVAFSKNSVIPTIDFASCHLYPESWNLPVGAGNIWVRDHIRLGKGAGKPLLMGEFGVRDQKIPAYDSWLTTALLDGAGGAMVWQILEGPRTDREGYGFRCPEEQLLCARLQQASTEFARKSVDGILPAPGGFVLHQNYPNPFNGVTTISYALPFQAHVRLTVSNILGQRIATVVDDMQGAGERKEVFDPPSVASGAYFYTLTVAASADRGSRFFTETKKLVLLR